MKAHDTSARQLARLLYVVFPTRERQLRTAQSRSVQAYVWGKRVLRSMRCG
jgi:hypothetical protein